jgi:preprotein translocase subunit SecG
MLQYILLAILIVDALALTGVILLQRSEGGALGMGGGGGAFLSVRGAGDLLTRTTWIMAGVALVLCVTITLLMNHDRANVSVTNKINTLNLPSGPAQPQQQQQAPASSAEPGAPPLPGTAPPLPGTVPALPTQAPSPMMRAPQRSAPSPATRPSPAVRTSPADPLANIAPEPPAPAPRPKIDLNAPASSSTPQP